MSRPILTARRARKPYSCDNDYPSSDAFLYGHPEIVPGQVYVRLSLPPGDDLVGNVGWMTARYCKTCTEQIYGWLA